VDGFLFDGWWPAAKAAEDQTAVDASLAWPFTRLYDLVHTLQPHAMVTNNHHVLPLPGEDYQVWEIDIPGENTQGFNCREIGSRPLLAWMTSTGGWSWQPARTDLRTAERLLADYRRCRAMNAGYFQNLGPEAGGRLNDAEVALLRRFAALRAAEPLPA
jgi:alpha-L-fucosidase